MKKFYFVLSLSSVLLFGCTNGQEIDEPVENSIDILVSSIQEKNENYEVTYETSSYTTGESDIEFIIRSLDENDTYEKYLNFYNEEDCDKLFDIYNTIFESIVNELRNSANYRGRILLEVNSYDNEELIGFTNKYDEIDGSLLRNNYDKYLKEDIKEKEKLEMQQSENYGKYSAILDTIENYDGTSVEDDYDDVYIVDNTIPYAVSNYLNQAIIDTNGAFEYEMVNGTLVIYTNWLCPTSLVNLFVFDGNTQYMNAYISSLPNELDGDIAAFRLLGFNNKVAFEIRTMSGTAYRVEYPEYGFSGEVLINEF